MSNLEKSENDKRKHMPPELRAVIHIFSSNIDLKEKALPYVDIDKDVINWFGIGRNHFSSGNSTAIMWARSIWLSRYPIDDDPFERSFSMDLSLRKSITEALAIAWGIS